MGTEDSPEDGEDPEAEVDKETIHRLCPTYATDINSPLRHVRTRIYFTSESHVHSLINVLRYSHLAGAQQSHYLSTNSFQHEITSTLDQVLSETSLAHV